MTPDFGLDRRQFLAGTARLAAGVGAALLLGDSLAGCGSTSKPPPPTASPSSTTAAATDADWARLATTLPGSLVRPGQSAYAVSCELFNEEVSPPAPAGIAYCASSSDVQRCVDFVRDHDLAVTSRAGGHSYAGYSLGPGLVIDVTRMNAVTAAAGANTATIGAGARLIDIYATLGDQGLLLPGGSCPTVGIAGLALGGGNFGIVTSFTFDVHPLPAIALFTLDWPWGAAADLLAGWQRWIPTTPDELWGNCQILVTGTGLTARATGVYAGTATALAGILGGLVSAVGAAPSYRFVGAEDYLPAMLIEAGCEGSTVAACHLPTENPAGTLSRSAFSAKSAYIDQPLPDSTVAGIVSATEQLAQLFPGATGGFALDSYGGVINGVAADATAFVHRQALACIQYSVTYPAGAAAATGPAGRNWLVSAQGLLAPAATGAYQNYIDPTLDGWETAYYGTNLPRLIEIKGRADPDNLFRFAQSIPAAAS